MIAVQSARMRLQPKITQKMIEVKLSCWKLCVILKRERGKLRKQHSKPIQRRSTSSLCFWNRHHNSLPTSSGSNCCNLKTSASSVIVKKNQFLGSFQLAFHGPHTKAGTWRRASAGLEREVADQGMRLARVLLLLHWDWVLPVPVCSLDGQWGGCFQLFNLDACQLVACLNGIYSSWCGWVT